MSSRGQFSRHRSSRGSTPGVGVAVGVAVGFVIGALVELLLLGDGWRHPVLRGVGVNEHRVYSPAGHSFFSSHDRLSCAAISSSPAVRYTV